MTTEDRTRAATRVRTATRARAGLVRNTRPLELPDELPDRAQLPDQGPRRLARRWSGWLIAWRTPSP